MPESIAVVGASLAGGQAVEALRANGFDGRITLIGEESWRPYQRPPLSKQFLVDGRPPRDFFLRDEGWYEAHQVELLLGVRAEALDLAGRAIRLSNGRTVVADDILLTTGSRARRLPLPGADAANVCHLRTKEDAERLSQSLAAGARIVVIGMGLIGAEVAASARGLGCDVTVVEPAATPMSRTLGTAMGRWLAGVHQERGVKTRFASSVARLRIENGSVRAVDLVDGPTLDCDAVVVGIGAEPATELARDAGLPVGDGINVDARCATRNPHVFAAGDVANYPSYFGGRSRRESFRNAAAQAAAAAHSMLGGNADYCEPCSFWSDQYELNLQVVGRIRDTASCTVRGSVEENSFAAFYLEGGRLEGVLTVNRPADIAVAKRMLSARAQFDPHELGDLDLPLRSLLGAVASRSSGGTG